MAEEEIVEGGVGDYAPACPHCGGTDFRLDGERAGFVKECTNLECSGRVRADLFDT